MRVGGLKLPVVKILGEGRVPVGIPAATADSRGVFLGGGGEACCQAGGGGFFSKSVTSKINSFDCF
jgi:hypothetical protein